MISYIIKNTFIYFFLSSEIKLLFFDNKNKLF